MKLPTKMFKKILLSTLLAAYLFFNFSVPYAHAQWYNQSFPDWYAQVYNPDIPPSEIFGERYTAAQTQWVLYSLIAIAVHKIAQLAGDDVATGVINAIVSHDISDLFTSDIGTSSPPVQYQKSPPPAPLLSQVFADRPLSAFTYFKYKIKGTHFIPQAHAQTGFGFEALTPVQSIWVESRDIAYSLFILISIALAFMIMFRVKLSAKTVVTIQSAIPKITIALILVTFSYAIAGFMVDLMYVVIGLISLLLGQAKAASVFDLITKGVESPLIGTRGIIGTSIWFLVANIAVSLSFFTSGNIWAVPLGLVLILFMFIFALMLIYICIKTFLLVIKTFVTVLILTIIGPIQITAGILYPSIGFGSWLKKLIATLAVFPTIGLLYFFAILFALGALSSLESQVDIEGLLGVSQVREQIPQNLLDAFNLSGYEGSETWPPFLSIGSGEADIIMAFVFICANFMLISLIPKTEQFLSAAIQGKGFAFGSAFGEARGGGTAIPGQIERAPGQAKQAYRVASAPIRVPVQKIRGRGGSSSGASAVP